MNEKELLRNLSALKSVTPSAEWVKKNREQLSFQIFNGQEPAKNELGWFANVGLYAHRLLQPAPIAALIALFFFVSGGLGLRAAQKSTPNDPLYIAKRLGEQAQQATTFDSNKKAELNLRFARNRAAEMAELAQQTAGVSAEESADVTEGFKNEIASVRQQLDRLNNEKNRQAAIAAQTQAQTKLNLAAKDKAAKKAADKPDATADDTVSVADSGKDGKKLEISIPASPEQTLEEAQKLFDQKKYKDAADKLGQIKLK